MKKGNFAAQKQNDNQNEEEYNAFIGHACSNGV